VTIPESITRAIEWWKASRLGRSLAWYGQQNGSRLCGGIAYSALFSLFGALTIGWTLFSRSLGADHDLRDAVLDQVNQWVPGLVGEGSGFIISPDTLMLGGGFSWTALVAGVVLLFAAIGVMGALRSSVRAMFGLQTAKNNAIMAKVWQLVGFVLLGVGILVSAGTSVAIQAVGGVIESWLGGNHTVAWLIRLVGALLGVAIDAAVVAGIIVVIAGARPRRRDLLIGAVAAGVVAGTLRWVGTTVIVGASARNALLAPFAAIITVLVLVNFLARVLLTVCAWMQDPQIQPPSDRAECVRSCAK